MDDDPTCESCGASGGKMFTHGGGLICGDCKSKMVRAQQSPVDAYVEVEGLRGEIRHVFIDRQLPP